MDPSRNCIMGSRVRLTPIPWSLHTPYGLQGLDQQTWKTTNAGDPLKQGFKMDRIGILALSNNFFAM